MDFLTNAIPNLVLLAVQVFGVWAWLHYRSSEKVQRSRDAKEAIQALAKAFGADNSEKAKAERDEVRRNLEAMRETFDSIPRQD